MKKIFVLLLFLTSSVFAFENLTSKNFDEKVSGKNVIVDFYKTYWGACKVLGKNLQKYDASKSEDVTIYKVDLDKEEAVGDRFDVQFYPIIIYFKDGKEVAREFGIKSPEEIKTSVKKYF